MLVPAMTFAWWLVSLSSPGLPSRAVEHRGGPTVQAASDGQQQDPEGEPEALPAEQAISNGEDNEAGDTSGERVTLKVVTPEIVRTARTFLDLPMGAERSATIDGRRYIFVLEHHYHPPGFVGGPHGWHKGVTVYGVR